MIFKTTEEKIPIRAATLVRSPIVLAQELRKFTGEALREPVRWETSRAWVIHAERIRATGERGRKPPRQFTDADIHALIVARNPNASFFEVE